MSRKRPYRSKMRIMADMMRAIQGEGEEGAGPTKILYPADLSHDSLVGQYNAGIVTSNPESVGRLIGFFKSLRMRA